jgi:hypothetical protein
MAKQPPAGVKEYLAAIGRKGGLKAGKSLSKAQAVGAGAEGGYGAVEEAGETRQGMMLN